MLLREFKRRDSKREDWNRARLLRRMRKKKEIKKRKEIKKVDIVEEMSEKIFLLSGWIIPYHQSIYLLTDNNG